MTLIALDTLTLSMLGGIAIGLAWLWLGGDV
jgi:hypothetical protein